MSISLGGVALNDHLSWTSRYNTAKVSGSEVGTLGGRLIVTRAVKDFEEITLEAIEEDNVRKGYFTGAQIAALVAFRDSAAIVELNYHGEVKNVMILVNGIRVKKTLWKSVFEDDDRYVGSVTVITML